MRISSVAIETVAVRSVIQNSALSIDAACSGTWILALVVDTGTRAVAVVVLDTFRSATTVRITKVLGQAGARASSIALPANGICSAGARIAGISCLVRRGD